MGGYKRKSNCAMVDFPDPEPPTINVVSPGGMNRVMFCNTTFSGLEGYAKQTFCKSNSPRHLLAVVNVAWVGETCGENGFDMLEGRSGRLWITVRSDAIEFLPFVKIVNCGTTICRNDAARSAAQNTVITVPGDALPSRTTRAPYQNPMTNVPSNKNSVEEIEIAQTSDCLTSEDLAVFAPRSNRSDSDF